MLLSGGTLQESPIPTMQGGRPLVHRWLPYGTSCLLLAPEEWFPLRRDRFQEYLRSLLRLQLRHFTILVPFGKEIHILDRQAIFHVRHRLIHPTHHLSDQLTVGHCRPLLHLENYYH